LNETEREMPQGSFEETRATARLPKLDIEIVHGRSPDGNAEHISISLQAVPSFVAFGNFLETANPFLYWMRFAEKAWTPWLGAFAARLPSENSDRLPATPELAGPDATSPGACEG
jgi:hypothetical protein